MLFHVYDDPKPDGYYIYEPEGIYRAILDGDWLLYLLLPLLATLLVIALMIAWHMHEIPQHQAHKKQMRQAELVGVLTVLGLFMHWVWAVALFFAYFDWDVLEDGLVRILRRARFREDTQQGARQEFPDVAEHASNNEPINASVVDPARAPTATSESKT